MRGIMQSGPRPFRARQALPVIFAALLVSGAAVLPAAARSGSAAELTSPLGSYLAGRVARGENDTADAAIFYRHALARSPNDARILERSFLVEAAEGNTRRTIALAKKLVKYQPQHRLARAWLGLAAFKAGNYKLADKHFEQSSAGPIGELTSALSRAWVAQRQGKTKLAFSRLTYTQRAEWAQYYLRYHRALIADIARQHPLAGQNYSRYI